MAYQKLVSVLASGNVPAGGFVTILHGIRENDKAAIPTMIFPDRATGLRISNVTSTSFRINNDTVVVQSATFRVERDHSILTDPSSTGPNYWQGFSGVEVPGGGGGCSMGTPLAITVPAEGEVPSPLELSAGTCFVMIDYQRTDIQSFVGISYPDAPLGQRLVIMSSQNSANGGYFYFPRPGCTLPGSPFENVYQGQNAAGVGGVDVDPEITTKQFRAGCIGEYIQFELGKWKMLSFQTQTDCFF